MSESHPTSLYKERRAIVVVCESLKWTESVDGRDVERDIDDFIANRDGAISKQAARSEEVSNTRAVMTQMATA